MTEISFFFTFSTKNFDFLFFDSDHLETYNAPIRPLEAEILSRCHFSETCWPWVVSTELALEKLFHENGCSFGTVGRTTSAQVSKRPWEQWLPAGPFRWSLFPLVCLSGFVIASVCIFHGFGKKSYFSPDSIFLAELAPVWSRTPEMDSSTSHWRTLSVFWPKFAQKIEEKTGEREERGVSAAFLVVDWGAVSYTHLTLPTKA